MPRRGTSHPKQFGSIRTCSSGDSWPGLRIGDTIALKRDRVKGNKLFLCMQKTGTPVYVPLPPAAVEALGKLQGDGESFFSSGRAKPQTARANWSRYLDTVFELAKVKDGHSHRTPPWPSCTDLIAATEPRSPLASA